MTLSSVLPDNEVTAYERELAERLGVEHVVAVSSGTAALQTALDAVNVRPGDEVLIPALSVVMSAAPIVHLGARPVFVDCNAEGTDFDYDDLASKTSERTAAVLPVHLWGRAGDTARLRRFADDRGLAVVADACQALGSTIDGAQVGIEATIGCFSTHELKLLSISEGGFLTTRDDDPFARHGLTPRVATAGTPIMYWTRPGMRKRSSRERQRASTATHSTWWVIGNASSPRTASSR